MNCTCGKGKSLGYVHDFKPGLEVPHITLYTFISKNSANGNMWHRECEEVYSLVDSLEIAKPYFYGRRINWTFSPVRHLNHSVQTFLEMNPMVSLLFY